MINVIINKQHSLTPQQEELLKAEFGSEWARKDVPPEGWTIPQMNQISSELGSCVFVSPIAYLLAIMLKYQEPDQSIYLMHNDKRDKFEKDGVISTRVAADGWQLIEL